MLNKDLGKYKHQFVTAYVFDYFSTGGGMAGFKFRTRTKSKYDRPKPQNFLETQKKEIDEKNKRRGKSAGSSFLNPVSDDDLLPTKFESAFNQAAKTDLLNFLTDHT